MQICEQINTGTQHWAESAGVQTYICSFLHPFVHRHVPVWRRSSSLLPLGLLERNQTSHLQLTWSSPLQSGRESSASFVLILIRVLMPMGQGTSPFHLSSPLGTLQLPFSSLACEAPSRFLSIVIKLLAFFLLLFLKWAFFITSKSTWRLGWNLRSLWGLWWEEQNYLSWKWY